MDLYQFKHHATWDIGKAYEVTNLAEDEWGVPELKNKVTSIPFAFDLFSTWPVKHKNHIAITYPTAKRSIGTLHNQYLNKNHIMAGMRVTEDIVADHDTIVGTMLAARLLNEPEEPTVFIKEPATCQVLAALWVLSEHGEQLVSKLRKAIAIGEKDEIGASYEIMFNDRGFIWRNKVYQRGYSEGADLAILEKLEECLGYSDGNIYVAHSYEGEYPTLLAGGADGFVLFHGAGIVDDGNEPAYKDTKGQFNLLAQQHAIANYLAETGLKHFVVATNQQETDMDAEALKALLDGAEANIVKAVKEHIETISGDDGKTVDENAIKALAQQVVAEQTEALGEKFEAAVTAKLDEERPKIEAEIREQYAAEAKALAEVLALAETHEVEVKAESEIKDEERALAREELEEFSKSPETALEKTKAKILDLPSRDKQPEKSKGAALPAGGGGGDESGSPFATPEEIEEKISNA